MSNYANSSVLTVVAVLPPAAGKADEVRKLLLQTAEATQKNEEGCLRYELTESADASGETEFVVVEDYKDKAAFELHSKSDHFQAFFNAVQQQGLLKTDGTSIKQLKKFGGFSSR